MVCAVQRDRAELRGLTAHVHSVRLGALQVARRVTRQKQARRHAAPRQGRCTIFRDCGRPDQDPAMLRDASNAAAAEALLDVQNVECAHSGGGGGSSG